MKRSRLRFDPPRGWLLLLFLLVVGAIFLFTFAQNLIMQVAGHRIMHDLRVALYAHIQEMPLHFFTGNPVARLVTRAT